MIADALGWKLQKIEAGPVYPVIAEKPLEGDAIKVKPGQVAGLIQSAYGIKDGEPVITLVFKVYLEAEEEYDSITILGTPNMHEKITPCVNGDLGTTAIIMNSIPTVINAPPRLKTMRDLPVPSAVLGDMRLRLKSS